MPPPPPLPSRRPCSPYLSYSLRFSGFDSTSYAKLISLNLSPAFGFLSGWYSLANFLYAFFSLFSLAPGGMPRMSYSFVSATFAMTAGRAALRKEGGEAGGAEPGSKGRQRRRGLPRLTYITIFSKKNFADFPGNLQEKIKR